MEGDPMRALAERYLKSQVAGAWFRPSRERLDFLLKLAHDFCVDGILWYQLMYREGADMHSYRFARILKSESDIPMLKLQSDWDTAGEIGPFRTRIEAFVEVMKRSRGG
jgi:benzoyl-CoA reductase/2-hydroxyglutaryl-CoA dehydratase subunit BcrC/BadD/HgdB